ncbi:MAG: hypothetical protein HZA93_29390 [Verrucomicrobia bacterium]|nr:hypothetical protein [Verrucomicrobiota bacterium]
MAGPNKIEVTLSFKPILDGLNRFTAAIHSRLAQVRTFNEQIRNGDAALQRMVGQIGAVVGAAAIARYAREAREADKVQQQLIRTLERTGQSGALAALNLQATALQQLTLFSDEAVSTVQRLLVSFGLTAQQAQGMAELVLDFAQETGQSAESAAMLIGRTLGGDSEELGRYRIQLDQTKGKVDALTEALKKFAAGAARGAVASPAQRAVDARYADATETLGRAANRLATPFLEALIPLLERAADAATRLAAQLTPIAPMLGDMAAAAVPLVAGLGVLAAGFTAVRMVVNPLRALIVLLAGTSLVELSTRLSAVTARFGATATASILLKDGFTSLAGAGRLLAVAGGIAASAFAGWSLGSMLNELELSGLKIKQWAALWVAAVQDTIVGAFFGLQQAWTNVRFTLQEGLTALLLFIREKQLAVQEGINGLLASYNRLADKVGVNRAALFDTKDLRGEVAALGQKLGELEQQRLAAIKAIGAARKEAAAGTASDMAFIAEGDAAFRSGKKPGAAKSATTRPDLNADHFGKTDDKAAADAAELARKRALFDLETMAIEAEARGDHTRADAHRREIAEIEALAQLGKEAEGEIARRFAAEDALKKRERERAEQEFNLTRDLANLDQQIAAIESDRYRTAEEKQQKILPLLQRENEQLAERIRLLDEELLRLDANDPRRLDLRRERADLADKQVGVGTKIGEARPQTIGQGLQQGVSGQGGFLDSLGTAAQNAAGAVNATLNSALQGTQNLLYNLATGSMTFRQAWGTAILQVGQQFLQATTEMVAKMIWRATIERALIALGVTTHVAGEGAKTAATVSGGAIRIATVVKEALASVYHGAIEAFKALASIPYVGPFLGAAAMAAALAGGIALVSKIGGHAEGGLISGPGTGTSDSIVTRLSHGEFVARASAVDRFGPTFFERLNAGVLDLAALPGNVTRGLASPAAAPGAAAPAGADSSRDDLRTLLGDFAGRIVLVNVAGDTEATRIARRSRAAGDVVQIVRDNRDRIFRQGPG